MCYQPDHMFEFGYTLCIVRWFLFSLNDVSCTFPVLAVIDVSVDVRFPAMYRTIDILEIFRG